MDAPDGVDEVLSSDYSIRVFGKIGKYAEFLAPDFFSFSVGEGDFQSLRVNLSAGEFQRFIRSRCIFGHISVEMYCFL